VVSGVDNRETQTKNTTEILSEAQNDGVGGGKMTTTWEGERMTMWEEMTMWEGKAGLDPWGRRMRGSRERERPHRSQVEK
jgi:hypothetical protein